MSKQLAMLRRSVAAGFLIVAVLATSFALADTAYASTAVVSGTVSNSVGHTWPAGTLKVVACPVGTLPGPECDGHITGLVQPDGTFALPLDDGNFSVSVFPIGMPDTWNGGLNASPFGAPVPVAVAVGPQIRHR